MVVGFLNCFNPLTIMVRIFLKLVFRDFNGVEEWFVFIYRRCSCRLEIKDASIYTWKCTIGCPKCELHRLKDDDWGQRWLVKQEVAKIRKGKVRRSFKRMIGGSWWYTCKGMGGIEVIVIHVWVWSGIKTANVSCFVWKIKNKSLERLHEVS